MKLIIVDDSAPVREQMLRLIDQLPHVEVTAVASSENEAVMAILDRQPDAVLLDIALAAGNGLRVLKRIRHARSTARVLVLSNHGGEPLRRQFESLGIDGFFDKSLETEACLARLETLEALSAVRAA